MVMVLMKLQLNVPHQNQAYRFGITHSTVSRTFVHWLLIMDVCLSPLIRWPERDDLWKTMPQCFKLPFGNKTTIIMTIWSFLCETNKPPGWSTNIQLWQAPQYSQGPHWHHPKGCIAFVSEAWGGAPQTNISLKIVVCETNCFLGIYL